MKREARSGKPRAPRLAPEIERHYGRVAEESRLLAQAGRLEFHRTQEIISRYLPKKQAVVLDVGGAAGIHAC